MATKFDTLLAMNKTNSEPVLTVSIDGIEYPIDSPQVVLDRLRSSNVIRRQKRWLYIGNKKFGSWDALLKASITDKTLFSLLLQKVAELGEENLKDYLLKKGG